MFFLSYICVYVNPILPFYPLFPFFFFLMAFNFLVQTNIHQISWWGQNYGKSQWHSSAMCFLLSKLPCQAHTAPPATVASSSVQFSSVTQSCPTLCDPMNHSTSGLTVHHQLPEFTQTHVYWVGDAIQPSHPLLSPSPPAPNPSQHQGLFRWVSSSHEVAKVLEFQL